MDLSKLSEPLPISSIDFRVQSISASGWAKMLAYKDARVDMQRLDDVVGPLNWKREHSRENHNCIVSIYNKDIGEWVSKEDTGVASNAEAQKGLASDSFKRACFNWGIGRELYDYPVILVELGGKEYTIYKDNNGQSRGRQTWDLKLKEWRWYSEFKDGKLTYLGAKEGSGFRFQWGHRGKGEPIEPYVRKNMAE